MIFDVIGGILVSAHRKLVTIQHKVLLRNVLSLVAAFTLGILGKTAFGENSFDISTSVDPDTVRQVAVVIEVRGNLKLNVDGKKVTEIPLRVRGNLRYDERTLEMASVATRTNARHYHQAQATISIGESPITTEIRDDRRLVLARLGRNGQTLFSPLGPLTRDELELLEIQGSTALLDDLAPAKPVRLFDEWQHDDQLMASLLGLDAISQSDVKSTLRQVEGDIAILDMSGTVNGAVDGVSSDIKLRAKYNIDLKQRRVTWLAMSIQEQRAIGHATPGFSVTARIRVTISDQTSSPELSDALLNELPLDLHDGAMLLSLRSSAGAFRLLHDRRWQVMVDRHDVTILRMIDQGDLIAQCNISSLPNLPRGKRVAIQDFQADIKRALGDNFGQFVEASQSTNDRGLRVLRTVAAGISSELPVQWVYYHIANDKGRQAALVFTMDSKVVETFAEVDRALSGSFEFLERRQGSPTPAVRVNSATRLDSNPSAVNR